MFASFAAIDDDADSFASCYPALVFVTTFMLLFRKLKNTGSFTYGLQPFLMLI